MRARSWLPLALVALTGCATQATVTSLPNEATLLAVAESFSLRGKLGVRTPSAGHSATIVWDQRGDTFDIELSGPVGIGRTSLAGSPKRVTITDREGSRSFDDPAQALLAELGWSPPLRALRYWAVGLPSPKSGHERLPAASDSAVLRFRQSGWTVEIEQLADYGQWTLPRKLTLTQGQTRLRLVATRWQVPATTD